MTDFVHFVKRQILLMVPFIYTSVLYFVLVRREPQGEVWTTILKCFPILALMFYVLLKGFDFTNDYRRSQRILIGLLFSCGGDALLNMNQFIIGMISFGIAHVYYISCFGCKPRKLAIGMAVYLPVAIFCYWIHSYLDLMMQIGIPVYSALISTMVWRAIVCASVTRTWLSILCAIGAALFLISDALIAITMFANVNLEHKRFLIMSTYYMAQFAIALSTANDGPLVNPDEKLQ